MDATFQKDGSVGHYLWKSGNAGRAGVFAGHVMTHPKRISRSSAENAPGGLVRPGDFRLGIAVDVAPQSHVAAHVCLHTGWPVLNARTVCREQDKTRETKTKRDKGERKKWR